MTREYDLALLPGDGIGVEVCESAVVVLEALSRRHNWLS